VVPYQFDKYEEVSKEIYRIFLKYTKKIQAVSCDEALLDVTGLGDPEDLAKKIREDIHLNTGCPASAGIGRNISKFYNICRK
jgi:DNA repair protein REV1